ncbi:hydroxyacylglutathione hydrolase [Sphingomonas sp. SORGH_AS870]|uniref:hydroxyacylglutathione hydrolase n=1 Tax=Sphingomonas sp. SORGH_AS_0870 TaxID=3041801 RepID=UPI00285FC701|nr:hydroxyacylglutathione hydrolase [Sphingomonas sp. SORGH_AS_0870]MDR6145162.1 hydroxyacylglutathione hydrolase [Sphingomonas sp. SORGH_AS_0870]
MEIVRVPVLSDNYAWLIHDAGHTVALDPGEAGPVAAAAAARGWTIGQVWLTHWHPDHVGGAAALRAAGATIAGPAAEADRIAGLDTLLEEGDGIAVGHAQATIWSVPGHTAGHIAFHLADRGVIFTGDTLFAMGCGRLFEGTAAQMHANMRRFAALPEDTRVYCGHEYTLSNARFAATVEPDNAAIAARLAAVEAMREQGEPTVPTTIALERATNPFLRSVDADELAERRAAKDAFRG